MAARIHIIDDDDAVRDSLRLLLDSHGYEVRGHSSAEEYLSQSATKADCLVVDQHMTGMTGVELLEFLRAQGDRTPALMVTGRNDATIVPRLMRLGVKLLNKPVPEEELVLWIEEARQTSG